MLKMQRRLLNLKASSFLRLGPSSTLFGASFPPLGNFGGERGRRAPDLVYLLYIVLVSLVPSWFFP
jgi:hypothetical protein